MRAVVTRVRAVLRSGERAGSQSVIEMKELCTYSHG